MRIKDQYEIWFITGSQHLYGDEVLGNVAEHSKEIANYFDDHEDIPLKIIFKTVVKSSEEITEVCQMANNNPNCIGLILWMHTFSPAKMWIQGLKILDKPFAHLHTQYNTEIPWDQIDMDFMNENQSAHGDREFGFLSSRMKKGRKVIVGHWKDPKVSERLGIWTRVASGWHAMRNLKLARLGDNMRHVAVTEGDKVEAQIKLGMEVNGYGMGDVVKYINNIDKVAVSRLVDQYHEEYEIAKNLSDSQPLRDAARIELGLRSFLEEGGFGAFTDTFENLHGMQQLPGISVQRLMADGYGFGAEGDWKTSALLHAIKIMDRGLDGGSSFMEDYTYDFGAEGSKVLGSHMLEICPTIACNTPKCEIHPLTIGGKEDPVRLVFDVDSGPAINVSLIDIGGRMRLIVNEVEVIKPSRSLPKLPVARVLWDPKPHLEIAAQTWILAGGAHHTVFSKSITTEYIEDFAEIVGLELLIIDNETSVRDFKNQIKWNEVYYHLFQ